MIIYIMNDFVLESDWMECCFLSDEAIYKAMQFLGKTELPDGGMKIHARKIVLDEDDMVPVVNFLNEVSSRLEWSNFPRDGDIYFQVVVNPMVITREN
jgi:hypothetical protein